MEGNVVTKVTVGKVSNCASRRLKCTVTTQIFRLYLNSEVSKLT